MTQIADMEVFAQIVAMGSMSAAGRELGLSPAVISKRIKRLEERLGVRLLQRTTRQVTVTEQGMVFYDRVLSILASIEEAESTIAHANSSPKGTLRVAAPTSFGRLHIAPHIKQFLSQYPDINLVLELSDDFVDIIADSFDLAIRIAQLEDSSLIAKKLAPNHRVLCATPDYLKENGIPRGIEDLKTHNCIAAQSQIPWNLVGPNGAEIFRAESKLVTNSSEVVREAVLSGLGIGLRSTWDVGPELKSGKLEIVLPGYTATNRVGIYALYPTRDMMPTKVKCFVEFLSGLYGTSPYWDKGLNFTKDNSVVISKPYPAAANDQIAAQLSK